MCVYNARPDWYWCRVRWIWSTDVANYDVESHRQTSLVQLSMLFKNGPGMAEKRPHCKHTFPRLARSTLNELQQKQHEKASLVCVRVESPSGLALVPWASSMVDLSGQWRCWIRDVHKKMFLFLAPYARTTRYEEAFLPKGKKRPRSLRFLGLAIFRFFPDFVLFDGFI